MCFLPELLHKRYIIYAYVVVTFLFLVLLKRECRSIVTELPVELRRIEITFQPYLLQLAQLLDYPFREIQGVSAEINQRQQFLYALTVSENTQIRLFLLFILFFFAKNRLIHFA